MRTSALAVAAWASLLASHAAFSPSAVGQTAWERYLALPSPENAKRVDRIEYSESNPTGRAYTARDLEVLELQIVAGDEESFRLTYRLLLDAGGGGGLFEDLAAILGSAIRPQPVMFLRELAHLAPTDGTLALIVSAAGLEYVDRPEAKRYELAMRRETLEQLRVGPEEATVRDQCLAVLQRKLDGE